MRNPYAFLLGLFAMAVAAPLSSQEAAIDDPIFGEPIRRVVTTGTADDPAVVMADGTPPVAFTMRGVRVTRLWEAETVPSAVPFETDATETAGSAFREGFEGTSFYVADIPPGIGRAEIPLHAANSVDYMAVLAGELVYILPDREIVLRAGDVLVQGGTLHTWENRGDVPARLMTVVNTAK